MESAGYTYLTLAVDVIRRIRDTQGENIARAAKIIADSIASGNLCHVFGVGHSHLACEEVYPRIGSYNGWHPMVELALSTFVGVSDNNGLLPEIFLENVEGYAREIFKSHRISKGDCMIVISNSGINSVIVEMAMEAKSFGLPVIALTSLDHTKRSRSRHSSGKKLCDIADIVIDNCVPAGDAMVHLDELDAPVAGGSTLAHIAIVQALVAQVAQELLRRGYVPDVIRSHNEEGNKHFTLEQAVETWKQRTARL